MAFVRLRRFCGILLLSALLLSPAYAQPRISIHIDRRDFSGNLLRLTDGSFIAEKDGELSRLKPDARFERKLEFAPDRPLGGIAGAQTYFGELLAPRRGGGFLAMVSFYIPGLGWVQRRLASFDVDGRLVESWDASDHSILAAIELLDGRVVWCFDYYARSPGEVCSTTSVALYFQSSGDPNVRWDENDRHARLLGCARVLTLQGTNVLVAGDLYSSDLPGRAVGIVRLSENLGVDESFQAPLCTNISQLAVQSDGRILARGRLADAQGVFESEPSVFRLNSDGSFDRRFLQASPAEGLIFSVATNDEFLILNAGAFSRYHAGGTLAQSGSGGIADEKVELLPDGSFLDSWSNGDAGGPEARCQRHHWRKLKSNGQIDPSFPPSAVEDWRGIDTAAVFPRGGSARLLIRLGRYWPSLTEDENCLSLFPEFSCV